jgi:hypothetical protein
MIVASVLGRDRKMLSRNKKSKENWNIQPPLPRALASSHINHFTVTDLVFDRADSFGL